MDYRDHNLSVMADYFASGCKKEKLFGLELEHFVVDASTCCSLPYDKGVEVLLERLQPLYGEPIFSTKEKGRIIGIMGKEAAITLEPAAQLEISIAPSSEIAEVERIYNEFIAILNPILEDMGCKLVYAGYHPKSKVDELPLIPKIRYDYMEKYFATAGTRGKYMMKGTAATQVSIDYSSEEDFSKKFRVANIIGPFLSMMYDNTHIFEGEPFTGKMARTYIWNDVDPARSMVAKGGLDKVPFGFYDYAEYVYDTPPIFIVENGKEKYTGSKPASEIFADRAITTEEVEHIIAMVFPDVRLKTSLELRTTDSVPFESAKAYMNLLNSIFYDEANLNAIYQATLDIGNRQVAALKEGLMKS